MSVSLMSLVWDRAPYDGGTLLVLLALADWADDEGITWPSMATLAGKARMQIRNTQYILRKLEADQMITRVSQGSGRATTIYRLNVEALCAMPLAWKRPGPPPPVAHGEQNVSAPDYVPQQNLHDALECTPDMQPDAPMGCNNCTPDMQPDAPMGCNPLHPTHHRSTNEPKDPLPPAELGGEGLATQGDRGDQKPSPPGGTKVDRARQPHNGDFDRATIAAMLRTIWREWGCEEDTAGQPHAPPGASGARGPAP